MLGSRLNICPRSRVGFTNLGATRLPQRRVALGCGCSKNSFPKDHRSNLRPAGLPVNLNDVLIGTSERDPVILEPAVGFFLRRRNGARGRKATSRRSRAESSHLQSSVICKHYVAYKANLWLTQNPAWGFKCRRRWQIRAWG